MQLQAAGYGFLSFNQNNGNFLYTTYKSRKGDTNPVKVYVKKPRGTLYWGGAGLDGNYIKPTLQAFQNAGIHNVYVGLTNTAGNALPQQVKLAGTFIDAFRAGLVIRYELNGEWAIDSGMNKSADQFNLIGYSYGSLLAAQTANFYSNQGHIVDHLVLIASPIGGDFLTKLKSHRNIKNIVILNLTEYGDQIYAGMPQSELLNPLVIKKLGEDMASGKGEGHFYYAHSVPDLPKRLHTLASLLAKKGIK